MGIVPMSEIVIFENVGQPVEVRLEGETLWLNLQQLADLFSRDKSVISRHLRNIFASGELERAAVVAKNATTATDGKTYQVVGRISAAHPPNAEPEAQEPALLA